ncbi:hypothetical protein EUX98_g7719 [Antrodiella citrinella]|uniref:Replication protein A C-terminal domain-containing protein n=1 Tax=Antrodiella citrinella TaxID=2447956 RepID=A0A4S4MKV2_9APHY|nr:hypothetical protein EUX98_g7719 [Antrodiella citrinella]
MSAAFDRQIRPVYDALETGSNKSAVLACNKLLKKQPNNNLVKALKALALVRQQKVEESLVLCDEVLSVKPTDDAVLTAMMHVLRNLGRQTDIISMYDNAYKQQPNNEDLAMNVFHANVRTGNWKAAQQVATRMHKQFQEDRYLFWSIYSAVLQARDTSTPPALRPVLYKLAHRLVSTASNPSYHSADRLYVHLLILRELELYDEALSILDTEIGKAICDTSLTCDEMRRGIKKLKGLVKEEGELAQSRVVDKKDRNWLEFLSVLDATFWDVASTSEPTEEARESCKQHIMQTHNLFQQIADSDGLKDRSGMLALLELEHRARQHGFSSDASRILALSEKYFMHFGDKACCVEDLAPYIAFESDDLAKWTSFLETNKSFATASDVQRGLNVLKLIRWNLSTSELTSESESARAAEYVQTYLECLPYGKSLPDTALQPADDLAILAGHALVSAWSHSKDESHLYSAVAILEYASGVSKQSYRIRLLLIRIYHLLGAPSLALEHYRLMNIKQVQADTLSHLVLSRATTFSLSPLGDITYMSECMDSSQIYMSNSQETAEFIVRAFNMEKYTQISEFIEFEDRLDNSLQRDLMKVEHVRMRLTHETINSDLVDMELIELKFIFDRLHHDNRDFEVIPNYQPRCSPSFNEQTMPFQKVLGAKWLAAFLKIYIKVFQQASDLNDIVEDKLLIGDRPKPSNDPDNLLPLNERLAKRTPEEDAAELTAEEQAFYEYATALSTWLGPYHDYARPPPSALLAEATKLNDYKAGHPLKALAAPSNVAAANGNGHAKKDEEPPVVTEPPEIVSKFFDGASPHATPLWFSSDSSPVDIKARFEAAMDDSRLAPELLHIATIAQEAFIVFATESIRFKPASVVKVNKFGGLSQSLKDIRGKASEVLKGISTQLLQLAEQTATAETRRSFVEASRSIQASSGFDHDYVLNVAKRVTDARKDIYEDGENPYYPNGGAGGGGGYMSGGGSQFNSPSGQARQRSSVAQSLRPLTIKQVYSATQAHTDAEWMLEENELGHITVVAQVMEIKKQTTNSVYTIEDGSGRIEARHWVDSTMEDDEDPDQIIETAYVRILGGIKSFGNKRYINTSHIRLCKDPSEFYFHVIESVYCKKLADKGLTSPVQGDVKPNIAELNGASAYTAPAHNVSTDQYTHLAPLEKSIVTFMVSQPPNDEGIHVGAIARAVGGSAASISAALDKLMDEGHVYTTLDESHYALSL